MANPTGSHEPPAPAHEGVNTQANHVGANMTDTSNSRRRIRGKPYMTDEHKQHTSRWRCKPNRTPSTSNPVRGLITCDSKNVRSPGPFISSFRAATRSNNSSFLRIDLCRCTLTLPFRTLCRVPPTACFITFHVHAQQKRTAARGTAAGGETRRGEAPQGRERQTRMGRRFGLGCSCCLQHSAYRNITNTRATPGWHDLRRMKNCVGVLTRILVGFVFAIVSTPISEHDLGSKAFYLTP